MVPAGLKPGASPVNIKGFDFAPNVPKYKLEHKENRLKVEMMKNNLRTETAITEPQQWQTIPDVSDNEFEPLVSKILDAKTMYQY